MSAWTIEIAGDAFPRFVRALPVYEQAVLAAAVNHVLAVQGINVCAGEWGRPLGDGLYEFRVRKSLDAILDAASVEWTTTPGADREVLLRVFSTFYGDKIVLLYHGYDKKRDPSSRRQQREIAKARRIHEAWRRTRKG